MDFIQKAPEAKLPLSPEVSRYLASAGAIGGKKVTPARLLALSKARAAKSLKKQSPVRVIQADGSIKWRKPRSQKTLPEVAEVLGGDFIIKTPTKNTEVVAAKWKQMRRLYESGYSLNKIAKLFTTNVTSVLNAKRKAWVPERYGNPNSKEDVILLPTRNARTSESPSPYNDRYITERYQEKVGIDRIARECNTPATYVRSVLSKSGILRPPNREITKKRFLNHQELNLIHLKLKIPLEREKAAVAMYMSGKTTREVAKAFGIHPPLVASLLKKHGVEPRASGKTKLTDQQMHGILEAILLGQSNRTIAQAYGVTPNLVYYVRQRKLAWTLRPEFRGIIKALEKAGKIQTLPLK